jgi:branched-chain amino acid transport system substrate-binding protein
LGFMESRFATKRQGGRVVKRKASASVACVALLALVVTGCGLLPAEPAPTTLPPLPSAEATPTETPPEPLVGTTYRIGFAPDVTGAGSFMGEPQRNWVEVLKERLEESGGFVGPDGASHQIEIVVGNTESNPDVASGLARRYAYEDEVVALIMGSVAPVSLAVAEVAEEAEVPYVSMAWSPSIISDPDTGGVRFWVFKVAQGNDEVAEWQVKRLTQMGASSVCYLYENTEYGRDCYDSSSTALGQAGFQNVFEGTFERTDTEFPQVPGIEAAGCDAVVVGAIPPGAANAHAAIRTALPDIPILHGHGVCTTNFITAGGEALEGAEMPCGAVIIAEDVPADHPAKETFLDFKQAYEDYTRGPVSAFGGHAYDALYWVVEALETLPEGLSLAEQRAAVRDYIENNIQDWPGTAGLFNLTPQDHFGLNYTSLTWFEVENQMFVPFPEGEW